MSADTKPWQAGATIVLQEVWHERLWSARPMRVVQDSGTSVVLWCPKGTAWKTSTTPPTRPRAASRAERLSRCLLYRDWVLKDFTWNVSALVLVTAGNWYAIWVSWHESGEPWGWYINLQRPFRRTASGLQTMDLMLDVLVNLERQWQWKDEDEFDALLHMRLIDEREASNVREAAQRVIQDVEANRPPFSEPWHTWRPDPTWAIPELPAGWDLI